MNRLFLLVCSLLASTFLLANVAQPGIYNGGGTGTFSLLYPEDSLTYQQIEMQQEKVVVQLYRGYAVVKGTYWMYNTASDTLRLRVGYPVNASFPGSTNQLMEINFDDLYQLRVLVGGVRVPVDRKSLDPDDTYGTDWYIWEQAFAPAQRTLIEVYFLVNTNDAAVLQGYTRDRHNAFLYLLETGSTWKGSIGQGEILVQLKDGLQAEDLWGGTPSGIFQFQAEKQLLYHSFRDLDPTPDHNIALVYATHQEDFDFARIVAGADPLFTQIEELAQLSPDPARFQAIELEDAFTVHSIDVVGTTIWSVLIGVPLLIIAILFWIVRMIVRRKRRA